VVGEHQAVVLKGELLYIEVVSEFASRHRGVGDLAEQLKPVLFGADQSVAEGSGLVIELSGRGDEDAAPVEFFIVPAPPILKDRAQPRLAARRMAGTARWRRTASTASSRECAGRGRDHLLVWDLVEMLADVPARAKAILARPHPPP
jgi:hypothetical protein